MSDGQLPSVSENAPGTKDNGKQADGKAKKATAPSSTKAESKAPSEASAKSGQTGASATRKSALKPATGNKSATATPPNARTATNAASRLNARQPTNAVTASPSDSKTKPSAVPQTGFMMGMGFTASARRGRGPKKAPVREAVLPPIKVLIVEDNPINQRILSMFMGKKKIKYDVANNGREAVDKWKTGGYHLILMDIQLPVMDGIEATKEIRKLERNANIGILPNTPPAVPESRVVEDGAKKAGGPGTEKSASAFSGGSRTLTAKGLVKHAVAGSDSNANSTSTPEAKTARSANAQPGGLVNGIGNANRIPTTINRSNGSINPFRASVIIVALTASVLSSDRVEALAAGCNDFLNKPVSLPWLNQKILEWGSMMYLMYSGLSSDDIHLSHNQNGGGGGGGRGRG